MTDTALPVDEYVMRRFDGSIPVTSLGRWSTVIEHIDGLARGAEPPPGGYLTLLLDMEPAIRAGLRAIMEERGKAVMAELRFRNGAVPVVWRQQLRAMLEHATGRLAGEEPPPGGWWRGVAEVETERLSEAIASIEESIRADRHEARDRIEKLSAAFDAAVVAEDVVAVVELERQRGAAARAELLAETMPAVEGE